ncbi:MAG: histidine kinase [Ferruginibacter sp.]
MIVINRIILINYQKLLCCLALILLLPICTRSQNLYSKTYTAKDGLPSSYILNTYEDKAGYLWIATSNGLSRFDGKYFTNYGYTEGLPNLITDAMMMDSRNRFWVGSRAGMAQLKGNRFLSYPVSDSQQVQYVFDFIETKKGQVWALTNVGVYEYNNVEWNKIHLYPGYSNNACRGIIETNEGMYINYGNLLLLKRPGGSFVTVGPYNKESVYYNQLSKYGTDLFISTDDNICTIKNEQLKKLPGILGRLKNAYYYFIDSKKRAWIASRQNGIQFISSEDTAVLHLFYKRPGVNLVSRISEDRHGNLWVSDYNGLVKITEEGYKVYRLPKLSRPGILRNIFELAGGSFAINDGSYELQTFKNGIFGKQKLQFRGTLRLPNNELIIDNYALDDKSRYWYTLRGFLLVMQDGNTVYDQSSQLTHLGEGAFDVLFDAYRKKILVAVRTQKFPCQFTDTGFSRFPVANNIDPQGPIMHLHQCSNSNIIFSTENGIAYSINKNNECRKQLNDFNLQGSFHGFRNDPSGDLWIVYYGRGLRRYTWVNDSLVFKEQIDKTTGLKDNNIIDLSFDRLGNMWLLLNSGILVLSKTGSGENNSMYRSIAFFNASDLDMEDADQYRLFRSGDANIWLATNQQLVCFYPDKINYRIPPPGIQIEDLKLNLQQTDWSLYADSFSIPSGLPVGLKLEHGKNTIGFNYKAVLSSGTNDAKFSYLLEGLDTSWSPPSSSDFVSFVNLPAGEYTFKVKTRLPNTSWSSPAIIEFEIKKAFWETWWFRLLVVMIAAFLIVSVFQYRLKQVRSKAELKNKLQELESKALKAQMNPHFIFNAMNSIQSLIINNRTVEAGNYISKFAKLMRHVLESADANLVTIEKELVSIGLYIDLEKLRMHVDLNTVVETDQNLITDQEKIPSLIIQPFVENALWHGLSKKEGMKTLLVKIKAESKWIICEITDNGLGREKASAHYDQLPEGHLSRATGITLQRLIRYNKTPGMEPIEIIDLKDSQGNPTGTTVLIHIKRETRFTE